MLRYNIDDIGYGDNLALIRRNQILKSFLGECNGNFLFFQAGESIYFCQCTLQLPDIRFDIGNNIIQNLVIDRCGAEFLTFLFQNGHTGFVVRLLDINSKTPLKTGAEPFFQSQHIFRRLVR